MRRPQVQRQQPRVALKRHRVLIVIATLSLGIAGCPTNAPKLNWDGTIYVGSSDDLGVVGRINGVDTVVACDSEKFNEMTCTDKFAELQEAYADLLNKCERWKR